MQIFSEGKTNNWDRITIKAEYETTRNGSYIGIRWKITWTIRDKSYFGYNINANVWTKGTNYGRIIKENSPSKGSGEAYFPNETDYLWFDNGNSNNNIDGCRITINSTNGGSITYDTGTDRTLTAPTGYVPSNISSNIDFNIGSNMPIVITDVTNLDYTYTLNLSILNETNNWQQIKTLTTTSKNFNLDLSNISTTLYNLLPDRNSAPIKIDLLTYYSDTLIGTTQKTGNCYVTNSNPNAPIFKLLDNYGEETASVTANFGPYNDKSQIHLVVQDESLVAINGATIKKLIIEWNEIKEEVKDLSTDHTGEYLEGYTERGYRSYSINDITKYKDDKDFVTVSTVDSRGNISKATVELSISTYSPPTIIENAIVRRNDIETQSKLKAKGKCYPLYKINYIKYIISTNAWILYDREYLTAGDTYGPYQISDTDIVYNSELTEFEVDSYLKGDLGTLGFTFGKKFYIKIEIADSWNANYPFVYTSELKSGNILMSFADEGVSFGSDYDENEGGAFQINGKKITELKKNIDANGWTVWDYGTHKEYTLSGSVTRSFDGGIWGKLTPILLPDGMSTVGTRIVTSGLMSTDTAITLNGGAGPTCDRINVSFTNQYAGTVTTTIYYNFRILE